MMNAYLRAQQPAPGRDQLVAEHMGMARRIALRVARRVPSWVTEDDLVAAAMLGLAEAADRYDPSRGEPFIAFAEKRIRGAVLDELRRGDVMPRRVRQTARRVGEAIRDLEQQKGRPPEDEEIAAALGTTVEHYRDELAALSHVRCIDLAFHGEEVDRTVQQEGLSPAAEAERKELLARLHGCLTRLQPRDALALSLYYVEELTYAEIGQVLGVSESRVCQLHARALARLRVEFESEAKEE